MYDFWQMTAGSMGGWREDSKRQRHHSRCGRLEELESRVLLASKFDGSWDWLPVAQLNPAPTDPGPYNFYVSPNGTSQIECPDFGGIPLKVKVKGDHLKGKGKSDGVKVKVILDNPTPRVEFPDELDGDIYFYGANLSLTLRKLEVEMSRSPD